MGTAQGEQNLHDMMRGDGDDGAPESCCTVFTSPLAAALGCVCCPLALFGCTTVKERTETVLMVFGKYYGTLRTPGIRYVMPCGLTQKTISVATSNMDIAK